MQSTVGQDQWKEICQKQECYELLITTNKIEVSGCSPQGIFYGVQTILQCLPSDIKQSTSSISIPCVWIVDYPQFRWRGVLLDVGRHFFPVKTVKQVLDICAMHKINIFHWHLTEDQGWRIEICKYPKLNQIGSWRKWNHDNKCKGEEVEAENVENDTYAETKQQTDSEQNLSQEYGGFYTKEDIKDIVEYANSLFIDVMPEIEMPGHCMAALASYPHLACTGDIMEVPNTWGIKEDVFCAGNEDVFTFLEDTLDEVVQQFPFEYIHLGCDEVPKDRWIACDKCQSRIQAENLKDENQLQSWFIQRISRFLQSKGKKVVCWDEVLEGGLTEGVTVMSWRGVQGGIVAADSGHDVIMTPTSYCYFDYRQSSSSDEPGTWYAVLDLKRVYEFDPIPESYSSQSLQEDTTISSSTKILDSEDDQKGLQNADENKQRKSKYWDCILGGQGNLWTEFVSDENTAQYMLLPRLAALSETLWSQKSDRDWTAFRQRLDVLVKLYDKLGFHYRCLNSEY